MANLRERQNANGHRQHGENGGGSGRIADPIGEHELAVREALEHIAELAIAQQKRSRSFTTTHSASIGRAGALFPNLHLPEESPIGSAYVENNSAIATLTLYEGSGANGRIIGQVAPLYAKRIAFADHLSSLSIVASAPDPSSAIVFVTLSTHKWSPTTSSIKPPAGPTAVSQAGAATGLATVYTVPAGRTLTVTFAMLSAATELAPGQRILLYVGGTAAVLVLDSTTPQSISTPLTFQSTSNVTISYVGGASGTVNWAFSGVLT